MYMRKNLVRIMMLVALIFSFQGLYAQSNGQTNQSQTVEENDNNGRFQLYKTSNIFNFIKLDKVTGQLWLVQWSTEDEKEFTVALDDTPLNADDGKIRYSLYPTQNMWTFLLLNKLTGEVYHVQWGFEPNKCIRYIINR